MNWNRLRRRSWRYARPAIAGAAGALLIVPVWLVSAWPGSKDASAAVAAWVQAVGSIVAIIGATWIAGRQSHESRERERRDRREKVAARAAADHAMLLIASRLVTLFEIKAKVIVSGIEDDIAADVAADSSHLGRFTRQSLRHALGRLAAFPLTGLRDPYQLVMVAGFIEDADQFVMLAEETHRLFADDIPSAAVVLAENIGALRTAADRLSVSEVIIRDWAEPGWRERSRTGDGT